MRLVFFLKIKILIPFNNFNCIFVKINFELNIENLINYYSFNPFIFFILHESLIFLNLIYISSLIITYHLISKFC